MDSQKGQGILEFAIVLPLFLLLFFGIAYFGMAFSDYLSLNNIARDSARLASISSKKDYNDVYDKYSSYKLPVGLYKWDYNNHEKCFKIENKKIGNDTNVKVTVHAELSNKSNPLITVFRNVLGKDSLFDINIEYQMFKEKI